MLPSCLPNAEANFIAVSRISVFIAVVVFIHLKIGKKEGGTNPLPILFLNYLNYFLQTPALYNNPAIHYQPKTIHYVLWVIK
jgi:hypothetical protein